MVALLEKQQDRMEERMEKQHEKMERLRQEMEAKSERQQQVIETRLEVQRQEAEAHRQELETKLEAQRQDAATQRQETEALRAEKTREQQLAALQARIDALHAATLLSDDERDAIEDAMADATEGDDEAMFVAQMAGLAEKFRADRAFSRQLRRKYCR
jgi:chromosome segregation ATPase